MLKELTNQEFQDFTNTYPIKSLYQTPEYGYVMNAQKYDSLFLGYFENGSVVAASLILVEKLKGFKYAYAPRGFLIDYEDKELLKTFTTEVKKYLGKKDIIALKISPLVIKKVHDVNHGKSSENLSYMDIYENLEELGFYHLGDNYYFEAMKPRYEAILDMEKPYYDLFQNFKKNFRTKIRGAVRNGIQIYKGDSENLNYLYLQTQKKYPRDLKYFEDCYRFFEKNQKIDFYYAKLNTQIYLKVCQTIYQESEKENIEINQKVLENAGKNSQKLINKKIKLDQEFETAKRNLIFAIKLTKEFPDGIPLASSLLIKHGKEVYLLMDGFDPKYKRLNAKHLLLWKLIEKYSKEGYLTFNFGGATNPEAIENTYKGLNTFKLGFNSNIVEYIGDFEIITNQALYFLYRNNPVKGIIKR